MWFDLREMQKTVGEHKVLVNDSFLKACGVVCFQAKRTSMLSLGGGLIATDVLKVAIKYKEKSH